MNEVKEWNVGAAETTDDLLMVIASAANGLKTQVIASPVLDDSRFDEVKERMDKIASELRLLEHHFSMLVAGSSPEVDEWNDAMNRERP